MSSKAGFLEVEILSAILSVVLDESPGTTKAVSLVNKHWFATGKLVAYRRQTLDFTEFAEEPQLHPQLTNEMVRKINRDNHDRWRKSRDTHGSIPRWLNDPTALRSIRHITVTGSAKREKHLPLVQLVEKLKNLKTLTWECHDPVPFALLEAIEVYHPKMQLRVTNWTRPATTANHEDSAEIALAKSRNLTTLHGTIWHCGGGSHPDLREAALQRIIVNAPNLKEVSVTTGHSGCIISCISPEQIDEVQEMTKKFFTHHQPSQSLKHLTLNGYNLSQQTTDSWGRLLDFSKLESFECSYGADLNYFQRAPDLFKNIKHVSLSFSYQKDKNVAAAADNYLSMCNPLETLSLRAWKDMVSLSTILRHGPTLKTLLLHEYESTEPDKPRDLLGADDVRHVREACPLLKDFTMDVDREEEDWEDEIENPKILGELARFGSQLNKLQLYFSLGIAAYEHGIDSKLARLVHQPAKIADADNEPPTQRPKHTNPPLSPAERAVLPPPEPERAIAGMKHIWRTVFGHRTTGSRALDIKIGEWERTMGSGYPCGWVIWEQSARSFIQLRPHERDDRPDEIVVTCQGGLAGKIEHL